MTQELIQIKSLVRSPLNVRKTEPTAALDELKASILAHGLMQNLVVVPAKKKGRFEVIAGGRRLEALLSLRDEGKLPEDFDVPCQVVGADNAEELSLAENTVRLAMHPADQFEAFAALIDQGQTAEQVATRFGTSVKTVEQRMKLAKVAPALLAAYRAEELTLDALMGFTVTDDHERQLAVYESLSSWQKDDGSSIRRRLTEEMTEADSRLAKFITLDAYRSAGGTTRSDLFDDKVYLEDTGLLDKLVAERLNAAESDLLAEGWGWVEVAEAHDWRATQGCTRIQSVATGVPAELMAELEAAEAEQREIAEQIDAIDADEEVALDELYKRDAAVEERLEDIEKRIQAHAKFDPEQVKSAGCYAYVDHNGTLTVERGLVKRQDAKKLSKAEGDSVEQDEKPKSMPGSLKRDLEAYRLGVAQVALANNPAVAFDLLVFKAAKAVCSISHAYDGPQVSFNEQSAGTASSDARGFIQERMDAIKQTLPLDWQEADNEEEQFAALQALTEYQKQALLAFCVARTLQPKLDSGREPSAYDIALGQTGVDVADHWRPTAENYLGRVTKAALLELGESLFGPGSMTRWANAKTGEIRQMLGRGFGNPEADERPDVVARLRSWLPDGMAFHRANAAAKPVKAKKATGRRAAV